MKSESRMRPVVLLTGLLGREGNYVLEFMLGIATSFDFPLNEFLCHKALPEANRMISLRVSKLAHRSRAFGAVVGSALNAALLQIREVGLVAMTLTSEALQLPLWCSVIRNTDPEMV